MSDDKTNDPKQGQPRPGQAADQPKRPYATIELKATEVKPGSKPAEAGKPVDTAAKPAGTTAGTTVPPAGSTAKPEAVKSAADVKAAADKAAADAKKTAGTGGQPPKGPTPPAPARSGGSGIGRMFGYLASAVLGGLIALFGADFLASNLGINVKPGTSAQTESIADLTAKLAQVRGDVERLAAKPATAAGDTDAMKKLAQELADARAQIAGLQKTSSDLAQIVESQKKLDAQAAALEQKLGDVKPEDLSKRVSELDETIKGLASFASTPQGQTVPEVARLTNRMKEISAELSELKTSGSPSMAAMIDARLGEARKTEAKVAEVIDQLKADSARRVREIEALKTQTERLEQRIATNASTLEQSIASALKEAGSVKGAVETLRAEMTGQLKTVARQPDVAAAVAPVEKRIAGVEQKLSGVVERDQDRQANAERIVLSLELANLKRVMETGQPYAAPLAQIEKLAGKSLDLTPLKAYQAKGVTPATRLTDTFPEVARSILDTERELQTSSTMDRLLASARSVVQVRRTGADIAGDSPEAVLARTEALLQSGNLPQAATQIASLDAKLLKPVDGWLKQLEARVTVDKAVKALEDKLKTSLAGGGEAKGGKQ